MWGGRPSRRAGRDVHVPPRPTPPQIDVQVNVTGLAPGVYDGSVRVDAAGVANSPLFVSVSLDLLPPGSNPGVLVRPTGLVFVQPSGGTTPAAQTVRLTSTASTSLDAVANPSTFAGGGWLTSTRNVTLFPGSPQTLSVQPSATSLSSLAPGQYFGAVSLLFGDQTSASVNALLLVTPSAITSCTPQRLLLQDDLGGNFGVLVNEGNPMRVFVKTTAATGLRMPPY